MRDCRKFIRRAAVFHTNPETFVCQRRFTLIELLIVISVISILAALLLPALNKAKLLAQRVSCLNNLKGYGMMMINYSDSYYGYIPSYYTWFQEIYSAGGGSLANPARLYRCPAYKYIPKLTDAGGWGYSNNTIPYGLNTWVGRKANFPGTNSDLFKIQEIKRPSQVIMIGDSDDDGSYGSRIDGRTYPLGNRHGLDACVVKVDGHTELLNTFTENVCMPVYGNMNYTTGATIEKSSYTGSERWSTKMFYLWGYWHSSGIDYMTR
ncbi:MAG: hypothetical protein BWY31_01851 [Lentisphaerae bacterium ADurb.Bin242]|nr:MAG: hypothetical protein BWY31_01851 [Lentisphaerae bacterium ADurb.Bin242]